MPPQLRARGSDQPGQKWVDDNFDLKEELKRANGGTMPDTPAFTTLSNPNFIDSDGWSEENPPEILFYIIVPPSKYNQAVTPPSLVGRDGVEVISSTTQRVVRSFEVLPDRISIDVPGWVIEAWRRLDPRIQYQDILDRMTRDLGDAQKFTQLIPKLPSKNSLQNHCRRNCRRLLNNYTVYGRRAEPHKVEVLSLAMLTPNNIAHNTVLTRYRDTERYIKQCFTRDVPGGILRTSLMRVTANNVNETTFPPGHFTKAFQYAFGVTSQMERAIETLYLLQERAVCHGYPCDQWEKLDRRCLPGTWFDRCKVKAEPNETYDGGCEICTWNDPEPALTIKLRSDRVARHTHWATSLRSLSDSPDLMHSSRKKKAKSIKRSTRLVRNQERDQTNTRIFKAKANGIKPSINLHFSRTLSTDNVITGSEEMDLDGVQVYVNQYRPAPSERSDRIASYIDTELELQDNDVEDFQPFDARAGTQGDLEGLVNFEASPDGTSCITYLSPSSDSSQSTQARDSNLIFSDLAASTSFRSKYTQPSNAGSGGYLYADEIANDHWHSLEPASISVSNPQEIAVRCMSVGDAMQDLVRLPLIEDASHEVTRTPHDPFVHISMNISHFAPSVNGSLIPEPDSDLESPCISDVDAYGAYIDALNELNAQPADSSLSIDGTYYRGHHGNQIHAASTSLQAVTDNAFGSADRDDLPRPDNMVSYLGLWIEPSHSQTWNHNVQSVQQPSEVCPQYDTDIEIGLDIDA